MSILAMDEFWWHDAPCKIWSDDIMREREVVLEEVKMYEGEDTPDELVHDIHLEQLVRPRTGRNILGSSESISQSDRQLVLDYFADFIRQITGSVAAAGNLTHEQMVARWRKNI